MTTAKRSTTRTRSRSQASSSSARSAPAKTETRAEGKAAAKNEAKGGTVTEALPHASVAEGHTVTVTVPLDRMASTAGDVVLAPVTVARKVLPAAGGLPLYAGLGALGVAGVLEWPVALGVGVGYAVLRHGGVLQPRRSEGNGRRAAD